MTPPEITLDFSRLENVKYLGKGIQARCPACAEEGGDGRNKNHLMVYPNGAFHCAKYGKDREHNRRIRELVGIDNNSSFTTDQREEWKWQRRREEHARQRREKLSTSAQDLLPTIRERFSWEPCDVWEDSPQRLDCELVTLDPHHFLRTLFHPEDIVWTGHTWQSGDEHGKDQWRSVEKWVKADLTDIGPMIAPSTWKPGTLNRSAAQVHRSPFTVLDFDELDGHQPKTQEERESLVVHALAVTRWLREDLEAKLAAIIHTGNKSLHVWIHTPDAVALQSLRDVAGSLGLDAGLLGHPEHPARLPGQLHEKSRKQSRVLWLREPTW